MSYRLEGAQQADAEASAGLLGGFVLALAAIYALLAIPLRSYLQPLIIMSAIPFGLVGAAWGHVILGYDFNMYSVGGRVARSGGVVNASRVFVDAVNRLRRDGEPLETALLAAARQASAA